MDRLDASHPTSSPKTMQVPWNVQFITVFVPAWMILPIYHSLRRESIKNTNSASAMGVKSLPGLRPPKNLSRSLYRSHVLTTFLGPVLGAMMKQVCWHSPCHCFLMLALLRPSRRTRQNRSWQQSAASGC